MLNYNGVVFEYDANGNTTTRTDTCGTTTYTLDTENRLKGIQGFKPDCSPLTASFKYDALNRRIEKTINGVTTQYLYDGLDIIQEGEKGSIIKFRARMEDQIRAFFIMI